MNLNILTDKNSCFYYWVQVVSGWDDSGLSTEIYRYYQNHHVPLSDSQEVAISNIRRILRNAKDPRAVLAELYSNKIKTSNTKEIETQSMKLVEVFEPVWQENLAHLNAWTDTLESVDFTKFNNPMNSIIDLLDSNFDTQDLYTIYLLPNYPAGNATGHAINNTSFLLVVPPGKDVSLDPRNTISTIAHEYIHAIEFKSRITGALFKESYEKYIKPHDISAPDGYLWKMMYVEVLVYCFSSKTTGGYLRPIIYQKPRPTVEEMKGGFWKLVKGNKHSTNDIINWVSLNILPDIESYIAEGRKIDHQIVDKISKVFLDFYLTPSNK